MVLDPMNAPQLYVYLRKLVFFCGPHSHQDLFMIFNITPSLVFLLSLLGVYFFIRSPTLLRSPAHLQDCSSHIKQTSSAFDPRFCFRPVTSARPPFLSLLPAPNFFPSLFVFGTYLRKTASTPPSPRHTRQHFFKRNSSFPYLPVVLWMSHASLPPSPMCLQVRLSPPLSNLYGIVIVSR